MHILRYEKIRHAIAFGIGASVGVLYFMSAVSAYADTGITVASNGQTIVRGALVLQVSGSDLIVQTEWGSAKMKWRVAVSGSTRFAPAREHESLADEVKVGERIAFSGLIDQNAESPTVRATMIRNETIVQSAVVIDGSVVGREEDDVLVATDTGTSTIRVSTGTIMTKDGNRTKVRDLELGETIKAFGTFNMRSRVLDAQRIDSQSLPKIPNTGVSDPSDNFLGLLISWLRTTGGALSLR